jgi:hypothetical protein
MIARQRPAVGSDWYSQPTVFFGVAGRAQALQLPRQECIPIASVMHDMIGDLGRTHDASQQAQRAQRLSPQLCPTQPAPSS